MGTMKAMDADTKAGMLELEKLNLEKALAHFESAYQNAKFSESEDAKATTAFNLGALLIAVGNAPKGISLLQEAIPTDIDRTNTSLADLFYNLGLGYEILKQYSQALKYFELALEDYQTLERNSQMEAEIAVKVGHLCTMERSFLRASRAYRVATTAYKKLNCHEEEAANLCQLALSMVRGRKEAEALQACDDCMIVCQVVNERLLLVRIYNELGLIYTQCKDFPKAVICFELALPLSGDDKNKKATILQNLGAALNSVGDYHHSVEYLEVAVELHAQAKNQARQGQCFMNLAYAYSQTGDAAKARQSYLHAVKASEDIGDFRCHWQALEGLGVVYFNQQNTAKSIECFTSALTILIKEFGDTVDKARIQQKLQGVKDMENGNRPGARVKDEEVPDVKLNGDQRPPSRQESFDRWKAKQRRRSLKRMKRRRTGDFLPIALGVGEYDSETDWSLSDDPNRVRPGTATHPDIVKKRRSPRSSSYDASVEKELRGDQEDNLRYSQRPGKQYSFDDTNPNLKRRTNRRALLRNDSADAKKLMEEYLKDVRRRDTDSDSGDAVPLKGEEMRKWIQRELVKDYRRTKQESEQKKDTLADMYEEVPTPSTDDPDNHESLRARRSLQMQASRESDSSSDSDTLTALSGTETADTARESPPPVPSPYNTGSLEGTYLKPKPAADIRFGPNYFREESSEDEKKEQPIEEPIRRQYASANMAEPPRHDVVEPGVSGETGPVSKTHVRDEDEPVYQTIRSMSRTGERPSTAHVPTWQDIDKDDDDVAPPLPKRPDGFNLMTKDERENYFQQINDLVKRNQDMLSDEVPLPNEKEKSKGSRMCIVM